MIESGIFHDTPYCGMPGRVREESGSLNQSGRASQSGRARKSSTGSTKREGRERGPSRGQDTEERSAYLLDPKLDADLGQMRQ